MGIEQRTAARIPCSFPAAVEGPRGALRGTCTNLSLGGAFLDGVQLPLSTLTTVSVEVMGVGSLRIPAQVRHHSVSPRGMGVQFIRLEADQLTLLQRALARLGA